MDCVWACMKNMDYPPKRIKHHRSRAARPRKGQPEMEVPNDCTPLNMSKPAALETGDQGCHSEGHSSKQAVTLQGTSASVALASIDCTISDESKNFPAAQSDTVRKLETEGTSKNSELISPVSNPSRVKLCIKWAHKNKSNLRTSLSGVAPILQPNDVYLEEDELELENYSNSKKDLCISPQKQMADIPASYVDFALREAEVFRKSKELTKVSIRKQNLGGFDMDDQILTVDDQERVNSVMEQKTDMHKEAGESIEKEGNLEKEGNILNDLNKQCISQVEVQTKNVKDVSSKFNNSTNLKTCVSSDNAGIKQEISFENDTVRGNSESTCKEENIEGNSGFPSQFQRLTSDVCHSKCEFTESLPSHEVSRDTSLKSDSCRKVTGEEMCMQSSHKLLPAVSDCHFSGQKTYDQDPTFMIPRQSRDAESLKSEYSSNESISAEILNAMPVTSAIETQHTLASVQDQVVDISKSRKSGQKSLNSVLIKRSLKEVPLETEIPNDDVKMTMNPLCQISASTIDIPSLSDVAMAKKSNIVYDSPTQSISNSVLQEVSQPSQVMKEHVRVKRENEEEDEVRDDHAYMAVLNKSESFQELQSMARVESSIIGKISNSTGKVQKMMKGCSEMNLDITSGEHIQMHEGLHIYNEKKTCVFENSEQMQLDDAESNASADLVGCSAVQEQVDSRKGAAARSPKEDTSSSSTRREKSAGAYRANWNEQTDMTSLLTISGALGTKKQLLIVPRSYLTVELVMAAVNLGKFCYEDIHVWICKILKPDDRIYREINRLQFIQYKILHDIISKTKEISQKTYWKELLKKTLHIMPKGEGWSLIFKEIPDICQQTIIEYDEILPNKTRKNASIYNKKSNHDNSKANVNSLMKKIKVRNEQMKVLKIENNSHQKELKDLQEELRKKFLDIKEFLKSHGNKDFEQLSEARHSQTENVTCISEMHLGLSWLYQIVVEKEARSLDLQRQLTDLTGVVEEKEKVIRHKNEVISKLEAKVGYHFENKNEKKLKVQALDIKRLQERLRKMKEMASYRDSCNGHLREEIKMHLQLLGEKDQIIAENCEKISELENAVMACRSSKSQLEHKLQTADCAVHEREIYIRSLEERFYSISQELKSTTCSLQEKSTIIQQQQSLLDQQKEMHDWNLYQHTYYISNNKQKEEQDKHLAELENRLRQCSTLLTEKEETIHQLQKDLSNYQASVKDGEKKKPLPEAEKRLSVRMCWKCSRPASKFESSESISVPQGSHIMEIQKLSVENEMIAWKDEKLRYAGKRVQELQDEVQFLLERAKGENPNYRDLKELLEIKKKNTLLQQCTIAREEMNAQLEEKLKMQMEEMECFRQKLQTKSAIIEYLQNFVMDKGNDPPQVGSDEETMKSLNHEKKTSEACEEMNGSELAEEKAHEKREVRLACHMSSHNFTNCHTDDKGLLNQNQAQNTEDKNTKQKNIWQGLETIVENLKEPLKTGSTNLPDKVGRSHIVEAVLPTETINSIQDGTNSYGNPEILDCQKTLGIYNESCSPDLNFSQKSDDSSNDSSESQQKIEKIKVGMEGKGKQQQMNGNEMKDNFHSRDPRLEIQKCDLSRCGRVTEVAGCSRVKDSEEVEARTIGKPSFPVRITFSDYCMRNRSKIPNPLSEKSESHSAHDGKEKKYKKEVLSLGVAGKKRFGLTDGMVETGESNMKESKRSRNDHDKGQRCLPGKTETKVNPQKFADNIKIENDNVLVNEIVKEIKNPWEEVKKLKKVIDRLKAKNDKELAKEVEDRLKLEVASAKRETVLAQVLKDNEKLKIQIKEGDIALKVTEKERERVNQLLQESKVALEDAVKAKEAMDGILEDKAKVFQELQKEVENVKLDMQKKDKCHFQEIEKYRSDTSLLEKEIDQLKLCITEKEKVHKEEVANFDQIISDKTKAIEDFHCKKFFIWKNLENMQEIFTLMKKEISNIITSLREESEEKEKKVEKTKSEKMAEEEENLIEQKLKTTEQNMEEKIASLDSIIHDIKNQLVTLKEEIYVHQQGCKFRSQLIKEITEEKKRLEESVTLKEVRLKEIGEENTNNKMQINILKESLATENENSKVTLQDVKKQLELKEKETESLLQAKEKLEENLELNKKQHMSQLLEKEKFWKVQLTTAQNYIEELNASKSFLAQQLQTMDISKEQLRKELQLDIPKHQVWNVDQELAKVCEINKMLSDEKKKSLVMGRILLEEKNRNKNLVKQLQKLKGGKGLRSLDQQCFINQESQTTCSFEDEMQNTQNSKNLQTALEAEKQVSEDFYKELLLERRKTAFLNDCLKQEYAETSKDMEHQLTFFAWMSDQHRARKRRMSELLKPIQEFTENVGEK